MKKNILAVLIFIFAVSSAFSEEVYLKNGRIIPGRIISSDTESINLKTDFGELNIARKDIQKIEYDKPLASELPRNRKFSLLFEYNYLSLYGLFGALPLWEAGVSFMPAPKLNIQALGSYFSGWGSTTAGVTIFAGYPFKLSVSPEVNLSLGGGVSYQYNQSSSYHYDDDWNYVETNEVNDKLSILIGVTLESFPVSYLPNFGYFLRAGIAYTQYITYPHYSSYSSNYYSASTMLYTTFGVSYYLF